MFGFKNGRLGSAGTRTLIQRAIASLRARGSDAHLWLPGGDVKTYGPELVTGNSSTFDSGTGNIRQNLYSTIAAVGGVLRVTQTAINGRAALTVPCTIGRTYFLSISLRSVSGAAAASAGFSVYDDGNTATYKSNASTTFQTITATKTATEANLYISLGADGDGSSVFEYDNISVREITSITPTITSGLTTGNYLESTGNSLATVDNPCGLVLDALGSVGAELVDSPTFSNGYTTEGAMQRPTGWQSYSPANVTSSTVAPNSFQFTAAAHLAGIEISSPVRLTMVGGTKIYVVRARKTAYVSGSPTLQVYSGSWNEVVPSSATVGVWYEKTFIVPCTNGLIISSFSGAASWEVSNISVREVSGIHLTQSTTANKGLLKQDAGSRYYWLFDATDLLTGTFPAGYESVTVIDAKSTGQVTTSAANVVGSYSIGPSYSSYGRIIIKGSITASELALYQGFANRLAGL